jgi:hypothetical protein
LTVAATAFLRRAPVFAGGSKSEIGRCPLLYLAKQPADPPTGEQTGLRELFLTN